MVHFSLSVSGKTNVELFAKLDCLSENKRDNRCVKRAVLGVILVRIFPHLDWIRRTRIIPNTDAFCAVNVAELLQILTSNNSFITQRHERSYLVKHNGVSSLKLGRLPYRYANETLNWEFKNKFSEAKRVDGCKTIIYLCLKLENKKKLRTCPNDKV